MAWRQVTKEEYEKWAAANPGKVGRVGGQEIQNPYPEAQDLGGIGNFLRTISRPVRTALAMPESIVSDIKGEGKDFKSMFLTPQEEIEWERDPFKMGTKGVVGLGAGLIPGGGGAATSALGRVGAAAGKGAVGGAMSGFGLSEEGKEAESTLRGGITGGILGGALQGVSEGATALSRKKALSKYKVSDQDLKRFGIEGTAVKKIGGSAKAKEGIAALQMEADELGIPTLNRFQSEKALNPAIENLSKKADDLLVNYPSTAKSEILSDIISGVKNIPGYEKNKAFLEVANILDDYGDELSGPEVREAFQKVASSGKVYSLSMSAKADNSRIFQAARNQIRGKIGGEAGDLLSSISSIYDIVPFVQSKAGKGIGPYAFGISIRPVGLTKTIDTVSSLVSKIPQAMTPSTKMAGAIQKGAQLGQKAIPVVGAFGQQSPETQNIPTEITQGIGQQPVQQKPQIDKAALAQAVLNGQISATEAKFVMDMYGEEEIEPETDVLVNNIQGAIDLIDQYGSGVAGKLTSIGGKIGEFFGGASTGTEYRALISDIRTNIIKEIAGTAQTKTEMKNLTDRLPKPTDEPAVAKKKLEVLLQSLGGNQTSLDSQYTAWQ